MSGGTANFNSAAGTNALGLCTGGTLGEASAFYASDLFTWILPRSDRHHRRSFAGQFVDPHIEPEPWFGTIHECGAGLSAEYDRRLRFVPSCYGPGSNSVVLDAFVIPEPSTWMLLVAGLGGIAFCTRRRRV
jgi:hypothetical protein